MASNSAASRRPLPQITERTTPPSSLVEGKDSGGRRHMSSSVPRTAFPPGPEKAAMKKLKQRMTFSDHSAGSSAKSTPTKVIHKPAAMTFTDPRPASGGKKTRKNGREAATDPARPRYKSHTLPFSSLGLGTSASFVPVSYVNEESRDESTSDIFSDLYASEGELPPSLTVSTLLSKMDSVKNFLKEAEAMREKFADKKDEPGMMMQLNKLDKLIDQLQQQESGYLGELIRLTELNDSRLNESTGDDLGYSEDEDEDDDEEEEEEEGEGESEEDSSDGEDQTTVLAASSSRDRLSQSKEKSSVSREGSSLSLRQAQLEMEEQAKEELLALQQQKEMLTNLLEKQKQIQELEAKQKALLEMKAKAEEQLKEAEAKGVEIQKLADAAEAQTGQPKPDERELLLSKLGELRARKERVDQITDLMQGLRTGEERGVRGVVEGGEGGKVRETKSASNIAQDIPVAQSVQSTGGLSEMVAQRKDPRSSSPNLEELQAKLREAAEARRQLVEARKRYDLQTQQPQQQQDGRKAAQSKSKKDPGILESLLSEVTGEGVTALERSLVSDYEGKLSKKKEEVAELLKEREELRATQKRLLALQKKMHFRQYLDESSRQNGDHEVVSQTDVTAATWGGSTVQSDPEDTASSVSLPSDIVADITQESNAEPQDHGEGATVEQAGQGKTPPFSVTRHAPRTRPNVRLRTHSQDSTEAALRVDKKLKMEATDDTVKSKRKPEMGRNPLASSFKASFKSPPKTATGETGIFGGREFTGGLSALGGANTTNEVGGVSFSMGGASLAGTSINPQASLQQQSIFSENTALLQNQLALTSHMCSQLLYGQNNLIRAVCGHLDRTQGNPQMAEQVAALQQYEMELEAYYHQLCESYARMQQHQEGREGVNESEEPVVSNAGNATNEGAPSAVPQASVAGVQQDPSAEQFPQSFIPPPLSHYYPSPLYQARPPTQEGRPATPVPMAYLPPPPPPMGNPYASPGFWHSQTGQQLYQSPFYSSQQQQTPNLAAMEASPFRHQHERSASMSQQMQMPVPGAGYVPQFQPGGVYAYQMPPFATQGNFGASMEANQGPSFYRPLPTHMGMQAPPTHQHTVNKEGGFAGLLSPSGVTASSMQVNAPTSPPSAPSVNNQPLPGAATGDSNGAEPINSNNNNTSSVLPSQPVGGGTLVAASGESQQGVVGGEAAAAAAAATGNGTALKNARAAAQKEGVTTMRGAQVQARDVDQDSLSSLPMSLPDNPLGTSSGQNEGAPAGFSVFDSLRDTIYSEVATLIANNENRPHFLVELFRELQMLSTDYLRQRALYNLQELVTRYLTEEAIASDALTAQDKQYEAWLGLSGANESEEGEEGSVVRSKPRPHEGKEFDYAEAVNSASSVSTPPNDPFASDDLGETVIKVDGAVTHMYNTREEADSSFTVPILGPVKTDGAMPLAATGLQGYSDIDTQVLDDQIKSIMMDVIPVLKDNLDRECDTELIILLANRIVSVVVEQEKNQKHDYFGAFQKQLDVTVKTVMEKYRGRKFRECGEDLLMDVSEVLFNELAFFKLMEDFKGHPQLNGDFRSVTSSQTTTEPEDSSFAEGEGEGLGSGDSGHPNVVTEGAEADHPKPLDPALLQVLSFAANLTLQEEEDTLGKARDDTLATSWDPKLQQSSPSGDEQDQPKVVELSVSESQPIQKVGSDEEEEIKVTEDLIHPPPSASESVTPTPTGPGTNHTEAGSAAATSAEDSEGGGGGMETPPTPIAVMVTPADATKPVPFESMEPLPPTPPSENGNGESTASPFQDEGASIKKAAAINKEEGKTVEQPLQTPSPPVITTMTEADLEVHMKAEQRGMEGIDGILSSMTEGQPHELGLVGDENEVDTPVNSNGI